MDTSAAIGLRDKEEAVGARMRGLASLPAISIVTCVELEGGVVRLSDSRAERLLRLGEMLRQLVVLDFDRACADAYRSIVSATGYSRRKLLDRMIAATALAHGATLVTANGADFAVVPGLRLEAWR